MQPSAYDQLRAMGIPVRINPPGQDSAQDATRHQEARHQNATRHQETRNEARIQEAQETRQEARGRPQQEPMILGDPEREAKKREMHQSTLGRKSCPPSFYLDTVFTLDLQRLVQEELIPDPEEFMRHQSTFDYAQSLIQRVVHGWLNFDVNATPLVRLLPFGSTASRMWLKGAGDMDVCVQVDPLVLNYLEKGRLEMKQRQQAEYDAKLAQQQLELKEKEEQEAVNDGRNGELKAEADQEDADNVQKDKTAPALLRPRTLAYPMGRYILEQLGEALQSDSRLDDVKILVNTRIPIIKCHDRLTDLHLDLVFNNPLAVHNTRLLATYAQVDSRVKPLVMTVKHWAKRRAINETYAGTLSSYAYVLMMVHYLQSVCQPPVLPYLQRIVPPGETGERWLEMEQDDEEPLQEEEEEDGNGQGGRPQREPSVQRWNVYFFEDLQRLGQYWPGLGKNTDSLGRLLYGFFHYWAYVFDYKMEVASVRYRGLLTKEEKGWVPMLDKKRKEAEEGKEKVVGEEGGVGGGDGEVVAALSRVSLQSTEAAPTATPSPAPSAPRGRLQRYWLCIEDPFETTHNLGRPVGRDSLYFIRGEFLQACSVLTSAKQYPRDYLQAAHHAEALLSHHAAMQPHLPPPWHQIMQDNRLRTAPSLLKKVCAESEYKTREEHKVRNKENMTFSERRRAMRDATGEGGKPKQVALTDLIRASPGRGGRT